MCDLHFITFNHRRYHVKYSVNPVHIQWSLKLLFGLKNQFLSIFNEFWFSLTVDECAVWMKTIIKYSDSVSCTTV